MHLTLTDKATGHQYILLEKRLEALYKNPAEGKEYTVQGRMKGEELVGKKYKPLFDYFYEVCLQSAVLAPPTDSV